MGRDGQHCLGKGGCLLTEKQIGTALYTKVRRNGLRTKEILNLSGFLGDFDKLKRYLRPTFLGNKDKYIFCSGGTKGGKEGQAHFSGYVHACLVQLA